MKKNVFILFLILCTMSVGSTFAQDQKSAKQPVKPALVVIDIQNAFLPMIPEREKETALYYINYYIDLFRSNGWPIILVYHQSKEFGVEPGTEQFEFPKSVNIKPEDPKVFKTYPNGFNKTDLDKVIRDSGSNTLFLCGLSAVGCVLATWIGASDHDYQAFMLKDAIMSHNEKYTDNVEEMFGAVNYEVVKMALDATSK